MSSRLLHFLYRYIFCLCCVVQLDLYRDCMNVECVFMAVVCREARINKVTYLRMNEIQLKGLVYYMFKNLVDECVMTMCRGWCSGVYIVRLVLRPAVRLTMPRCCACCSRTERSRTSATSTCLSAQRTYSRPTALPRNVLLTCLFLVACWTSWTCTGTRWPRAACQHCARIGA